MPAPGAQQLLVSTVVAPNLNAGIPGNLPVKDVLMDVTYNNQTASFNDANILDTLNYRYLEVTIVGTVNSGTGITIQVDLLNCLDAAGVTKVDFFNDGTKPVPGGNSHFYGPGVNNNVLIPRFLSLSYTIAGTTPNINFRVVVRGYL